MFVITASNISNLADISDYDVRVFIAGQDSNFVLWQGQVLGHRRADGWQELTRKILKEIDGTPRHKTMI